MKTLSDLLPLASELRGSTFVRHVGHQLEVVNRARAPRGEALPSLAELVDGISAASPGRERAEVERVLTTARWTGLGEAALQARKGGLGEAALRRSRAQAA